MIALPAYYTNWMTMLFLHWSANTVTLCRWRQTGARNVPWGTHVSTARLTSAVAVLGSTSWWPIKLSLHSMDWSRHGIQADRAWGGEIDKQQVSMSTAPSCKFKSAPSELGCVFLQHLISQHFRRIMERTGRGSVGTHACLSIELIS